MPVAPDNNINITFLDEGAVWNCLVEVSLSVFEHRSKIHHRWLCVIRSYGSVQNEAFTCRPPHALFLVSWKSFGTLRVYA
jgi:hypothetical protein